MVGGKFVSI